MFPLELDILRIPPGSRVFARKMIRSEDGQTVDPGTEGIVRKVKTKQCLGGLIAVAIYEVCFEGGILMIEVRRPDLVRRDPGYKVVTPKAPYKITEPENV